MTEYEEFTFTDSPDQSEMVAEVVHQIKTPLALLRLHWEDEINNPDLPGEIKIKIARSVESVARLSRLVNNLLLLYQSEYASTGFTCTSLRLDELLADVTDDMHILAEEKNHSLHVTGLTETTITGDRDRLYQLFYNLIDNAVKYTPDSGAITVDLQRGYQWVTIDIGDSGEGIPPRELQSIFKRFYRGGNHRRRGTGGSGLGLTICRMIAEAHEGNIEVESTPGVGSTFRVSLPLSRVY